MNKNEIFRKFLQNPHMRDQIDFSEKQIDSMTLYNETSNKLIEVIRITIIHLDEAQSTDVIARKVNQFLKQ